MADPRAGKRLRTLLGLLGMLRTQSGELGEDCAALAAEAHPSLCMLQCAPFRP